MSDSINTQTAKQVARLARIELSDDQATDVQQQLSKVLDYIGHLDEANLPVDAEPFFGAVESVNAVREDMTAPSFPRESILENAPDTDGEFYLVPPVF